MSEKEPNVFQAINLVMRDLSAIGKDQLNAAQKYKFRGIDDVYNELHPLMAKHGLFNYPVVLSRNEEIYTNNNGTRMIRVVLQVEYVFCSKDGSTLKIGPVHSEGNDTADKATNKALSAAHKYACIQLFMIPTKDSDDADATHVEIPPTSVEKKAIPNMAPQSKPIANYNGEPLIKIGKNKGKKYTDIPLHDLLSMVEWLRNEALKKSQPVSKLGSEFIEEVLKLQNKNRSDEFNQLPEPPPEFPFPDDEMKF